MILNLLNTLLLSASVSLGATNNFTNEMKPNRANENTNFSINYTLQNSTNRTIITTQAESLPGIPTEEADTDGFVTVYENLRTVQRIYDYTVNGQNLYSNIRRLQTYTQGDADPYNTISVRNRQNSLSLLGKTDVLMKYHIINGTRYNQVAKNVGVESKLYFVRARTIKNIINTTIKIQENYTPVYGATDFKTTTLITRKEINNYFTSNDYEFLFKNNNLIDTYNTLKEQLGYDANEIKQAENITYDNINESETSEGTINLQVPSNNNYIYAIMYVENQHRGNNLQELTQLITRGMDASGILHTIEGLTVNANVDLEVVDVGGVMFDVLGMPFTFISTAFNLTIFPNTPYEVNLSTLFLSVFAVVVFVFIVKMIIGAIGNK